MHGQQNIILRCTVSKTLYWDARSAEHYTEMHGQQNIKIPYLCLFNLDVLRILYPLTHDITLPLTHMFCSDFLLLSHIRHNHWKWYRQTWQSSDNKSDAYSKNVPSMLYLTRNRLQQSYDPLILRPFADKRPTITFKHSARLTSRVFCALTTKTISISEHQIHYFHYHAYDSFQRVTDIICQQHDKQNCFVNETCVSI
jgi:hypothetical protein